MWAAPHLLQRRGTGGKERIVGQYRTDFQGLANLLVATIFAVVKRQNEIRMSIDRRNTLRQVGMHERADRRAFETPPVIWEQGGGHPTCPGRASRVLVLAS